MPKVAREIVSGTLFLKYLCGLRPSTRPPPVRGNPRGDAHIAGTPISCEDPCKTHINAEGEKLAPLALENRGCLVG
jgi:hypothetical protein